MNFLHGALYTPPQHRERVLNTHSFTCLPADLRDLLAVVWGRRSEFRDYSDISYEVCQAWYPHFYAPNTVPLFK